MSVFGNPLVIWWLVAMMMAMVGATLCVLRPYPSPSGAMGLMAFLIGVVALVVLIFMDGVSR